MNQETQSQPRQTGCLKIILIIGASAVSILFILMIIYLLSLNTDKTNKKRIPKKELAKKDSLLRNENFKHGWKVVPDSLKENEIKRFINSDEKYYVEKRFLLNNDINQVIRMSAKYPETVQYLAINGEYTKEPNGYTIIKPQDFSNINYKEGSFVIEKPFKSENKLGMLVRSSGIFTVKFDGLKYTVTDVKFD